MSSTVGDSPSTSTFDFGTRLGYVFIVETAGLSALTVSGLLCYMIYSAFVDREGASRAWKVSSHIHYYFVSLLISDLLQAIGGILNVKWVIDARIVDGALCKAQGIFKNMGDVAVALSSLSIAVHTLFVLAFRRDYSPKIALVVVGCIWLFVSLIVGISLAIHGSQSYYGDTGDWCWITERFATERLALEYIWLWIAAFGNIVCYVFIALVMKGYLLVDGWTVRRRRFSDPNLLESLTASMKRSNAVARQMLFYPAVYIITVSPLSVVRWMAFKGMTPPFAATCVSAILFAASGILNVLLFTLTRPGLVPNRNSRALQDMLRSARVSAAYSRPHSPQTLGQAHNGSLKSPRHSVSKVEVLQLTPSSPLRTENSSPV